MVDHAALVWALYGRESFDPKGTAEQVKAQLADMRGFVGGIGGTVGHEYPENNVSAFRRVRVSLPDGTYGYRVVRPDWDAMMTALRRGEFNALCLPNIDRGMRDPRDLEDLIDLVEHYGVYVVGLTGSLDLTTDEGIGSARHEVAQRNQESRNISRRMTTGNRRAALAGKHHGGANRPFGWRKDRVTVNKREAKHIRRELPRLLAGVSTRSIAIEWNERGIPTVTGAQWRAMTIQQIFTNPRLCGWRVYRGEVLRNSDGSPVLGSWEPILTAEEHEAVVTALRAPDADTARRRGRGKTTKRLLSPYVRCGKCSARMYGAVTVGVYENGETRFQYRCPPKGMGGCGGVARSGQPVDDYVTELVLTEQSRIAVRKLTELPPWDREADLQATIAQIKEATENYKARKISGGRYFPLLQDLENEERKLKADKRRYEARRQSRIEAAADLRVEWNRPGFTLEQKQAAIARSIAAVVIHSAPRQGAKFHPDQITIVWADEAS